jgi:hypothetical protein
MEINKLAAKAQRQYVNCSRNNDLIEDMSQVYKLFFDLQRTEKVAGRSVAFDGLAPFFVYLLKSGTIQLKKMRAVFKEGKTKQKIEFKNQIINFTYH